MTRSVAKFARHPAVAVWAVLMLATILSWWLGLDHRFLSSSKSVTASAIMLIAFVKVHLVGTYFMDLRRAPVALRAAFNAWTISTCALVIGLYIFT